MCISPEIQQLVAQTLSGVAARIRTLRQERGLTVQELAARCDMERSNLSRIEAGRSNLTLRTLCILSAMLDTDLQELLPPRAAFREHPDKTF